MNRVARGVMATYSSGRSNAGYSPSAQTVKDRPYEDFRWSRFKNFAPAEMYIVVAEHVFPFLRTLGGDESTYSPRKARCWSEARSASDLRAGKRSGVLLRSMETTITSKGQITISCQAAAQIGAEAGDEAGVR